MRGKVMAQRLKRWESPRRQGRNSKGKGGSARQRQLKKQQQMLRRKLKENSPAQSKSNQRLGGRDRINSSLFIYIYNYLRKGCKNVNFKEQKIDKTLSQS